MGSVGIVRSRTQTMEFCLFLFVCLKWAATQELYAKFESEAFKLRDIATP
jgi:hypothetical protein